LRNSADEQTTYRTSLITSLLRAGKNTVIVEELLAKCQFYYMYLFFFSTSSASNPPFRAGYIAWVTQLCGLRCDLYTRAEFDVVIR